MEQPVDKNLLKKFLHNTCTADEIAQVTAFLLKPGSDELLHEIMEEEWADSWNDEGKDDGVINLKEMTWNRRVHQRIAAYNRDDRTVVPFYKARFRRYAAIWAGVLFIIGGGFGLFRLRKQQAPASDNMVKSFTGAGKLIRLQLSDSTIVYLNASSSIKYPVAFTGEKREVYINGEAFFDVAPDKTRPFLIHTDDLNVQVLGTSFDIRSYKDDKDASVTVSTGKVGIIPVSKNTSAMFLLPGNQLTINKKSGETSRMNVDPAEVNSWQTGVFIFNYETLENITRRLEHWYGISFTIKNHALLNQRYKLKEKNTDLATVMNSLSHAGNGFHYAMANKQVIIW